MSFQVSRDLHFVLFYYYLRVPFYVYKIIYITNSLLPLDFFWYYKQCHDENFYLVTIAHLCCLLINSVNGVGGSKECLFKGKEIKIVLDI